MGGYQVRVCTENMGFLYSLLQMCFFRFVLLLLLLAFACFAASDRLDAFEKKSAL